MCNAEKGAVNVEVTVDTVCPAGHSSGPTAESNVGVLARAVAALEANPFPAHMDGYIRTLTFLASELPLALRVMAANAWLFKPILNVSVDAMTLPRRCANTDHVRH